MNDITPVETHPWEPFIPPHARILIMGTFPPASNRWTMNFYYPNRINDFWRVMGLVFFDNPLRFWNELTKSFRLEDIINFLTERGIAMSDTAYQVRRLKGNASDKFLEIVTPNDLDRLLEMMPECRTVATTGQKAAQVIAQLTGSEVPAIGERVQIDNYGTSGRSLGIYRMPSTSRAYPLPLSGKAAAYRAMFEAEGLL